LILPYNIFFKTINKNNLKQIVFYKNALYPQKQTGVQRFFLGHGLLHMNRLACPTWMMGRSAVILIQLIPVQKCYLGPTMKSQYYKLYSESTSSPLLQRHKIIRCGSSSLDPEFPKKGETERASSFSTRLKKIKI
jgi:hypothetical protein